jgi:Transposase, Mutator family
LSIPHAGEATDDPPGPRTVKTLAALAEEDRTLDPLTDGVGVVVQTRTTNMRRGVSIRRVEGLVEMLAWRCISYNQVSRMATELAAGVVAFRSRPLDGGPYTYVSLDAVTRQLREAGS